MSDSPNPLTVVSQANGKMVRDSLSAKTAWPASSRPRLVRHQTPAPTVTPARAQPLEPLVSTALPARAQPLEPIVSTALPEPSSLLQDRRLATTVPPANSKPRLVRQHAKTVLSANLKPPPALLHAPTALPEPSSLLQHRRLATTVPPASTRPLLVRRSAMSAKLTAEPALPLVLLL